MTEKMEVRNKLGKQEMVEKLDMSEMVADVKADDAKINQRLLEDTQETYKVLLFHVKDLECLISHKEPSICWRVASAELIFDIGDERLKIVCSQWKYTLSYGIKSEDGSELYTRRWHKDTHSEDDVAKVCQSIALWAGRSLNNKSCEDQ